MRRSHGTRNRTRHKLRVRPRDRGKVTITSTMRTFAVGSRAQVIMDPRLHKGMPHRRFQGLTAMVTGTQGEAVVVEVHSGNKLKTLVVRPEHLRPA